MNDEPQADRLRRLLLTAHVLAVDARGSVTAWPPAAEHAFGWDSTDVVGRPLLEAIAPNRLREDLERRVGALLAGDVRTAVRLAFDVRRREGGEARAELTLVPVPHDGSHLFSALLRAVLAAGPEPDLGRLAREHAEVLGALDAALAPAGAGEPEPAPPTEDATLAVAGAFVIFDVAETREARSDEPELAVAAQAPPAEPEHRPEPQPVTALARRPGRRAGSAATAPVTEAALYQAFEAEAFALALQPVLDLRTDEVTQHEVLLRVVGEHGALLLPSAFLEVALRCGLAAPIDRWVLRHAVALVAAQERDGGRARLAVNLSSASLADPAFADALEQELAAAAIDPASIVLEVKEAAVAGDPDAARVLVRRARSLGCRIALDDFGASFATLRQLKDLPVDYLELDGALVATVRDSRADRALVRAVVELGRGIDAEVIAKWVTDDETLVALRREGVACAQGHAVGRPVVVLEPGRPPAEVAAIGAR